MQVKSALVGASVTVPVTDGKLALGTWQGIWLCEHRDAGGPRTVLVPRRRRQCRRRPDAHGVRALPLGR